MKIDINETSTIEFIASLKPKGIYWSNIPDYIDPKNFLKIAQKCSMPHSGHEMEFKHWHKRVWGNNLLDFGDKMQNTYSYYHY